MIVNLKLLREKLGISQQRLATAVGVSQQSINKYENHNVEPDIKTLILIADFFGTSVDYLVGHSDPGDDMSLSPAYLSDEEVKLITGYRNLSLRERQSVRMIIENYNN